MAFSKYWNLVDVTGHYVGSDGSSVEGFIILHAHAHADGGCRSAHHHHR